MVTTDRDALIRQLRNLSTEKLAQLLRERDTSRWRAEVFEIAERLLTDRGEGHKVTVVSPRGAGVAEQHAAKPTPTAHEPPAPASTPTPAVGATLPFEATRGDSIAVYCSDGRLAPLFDEFVSKTLQLPRCDRLALPGGPVLLSGRLASFWEGSGVENQFRFLVEAHSLKRAVLIAHQDCGYYVRKLGLTPPDLEAAQLDDIRKAAVAIRRHAEGLDVKAFFARYGEGRVIFEPIGL
jgi:hypothetical protein